MNELKKRNTFSVATQSFTRLGDHQVTQGLFFNYIRGGGGGTKDPPPPPLPPPH